MKRIISGLFYLPTTLIHRYFLCKRKKHTLIRIQKFSDELERVECIYCCNTYLIDHTNKCITNWDEINEPAIVAIFGELLPVSDELKCGLRKI